MPPGLENPRGRDGTDLGLRTRSAECFSASLSPNLPEFWNEASAIMPTARITEPDRVAGIGLVSGTQDQPIARDQGRKPAAHRRAAPRHGDLLRKALPIWAAQVLPE